MPQDIKRVPGDNPGGNNKIYFANADDITVYPNIIDGGTSVDITFAAGRGWRVVETIENSLGFDESVTQSDNGPVYQVSIKGAIRGDNKLNRILLSNAAKNNRFVIKIRDNVYMIRLTGTPDEVLAFNYKFTTGNSMPALRSYNIEFAGSFSAPIPVLTI